MEVTDENIKKNFVFCKPAQLSSEAMEFVRKVIAPFVEQIERKKTVEEIETWISTIFPGTNGENIIVKEHRHYDYFTENLDRYKCYIIDGIMFTWALTFFPERYQGIISADQLVSILRKKNIKLAEQLGIN